MSTLSVALRFAPSFETFSALGSDFPARFIFARLIGDTN
jgi:hypothetical protein